MSTNTAPPFINSTAVMLAADRLSVSRVQLQQAMKPPPHAANTGDGSARPPLVRWLDRLTSTPAASIVLETVQRWWAKHPMRLVLLLADDAAQTVMEPLARKHPYRLVLGAAAVGALLVLTRSWRWLPRTVLTPAITSTLMAGLLPTLISQVKSPSSASAWNPYNQ